MNPLLINLARRRFGNQRPALRAAVLLWLLALGALAANGWLYREYFQGSGERGRRLAEIESSLRAEAETIAAARARLAEMDLVQQNAVVEFLNQQIGLRTFSWSRLFDRLATVLPEEVRLSTLAPEQAAKRTGRAAGKKAGPGAAPRESAVVLNIAGTARSDEALSEFQDRLFAHPSFRGVNLAREARLEGDFLRFDLTVEYLPGKVEDEPQVSAAPAAVGGEEER